MHCHNAHPHIPSQRSCYHLQPLSLPICARSKSAVRSLALRCDGVYNCVCIYESFLPLFHPILSLSVSLNRKLICVPFSATLNDATDILSGGTLTLNGVTVIIPKNLLVNTPSLTAVAWSEMFKEDGTINLPLWPAVNWEASVSPSIKAFLLRLSPIVLTMLFFFSFRSFHCQIFANFIGGRYIAGIVYIFQETGQTSEGFITHIDYEKGEMRVGGDFNNPATTGVRVVINDPGVSASFVTLT